MHETRTNVRGLSARTSKCSFGVNTITIYAVRVTVLRITCETIRPLHISCFTPPEQCSQRSATARHDPPRGSKSSDDVLLYRRRPNENAREVRQKPLERKIEAIAVQSRAVANERTLRFPCGVVSPAPYDGFRRGNVPFASKRVQVQWRTSNIVLGGVSAW